MAEEGSFAGRALTWIDGHRATAAAVLLAGLAAIKVVLDARDVIKAVSDAAENVVEFAQVHTTLVAWFLGFLVAVVAAALAVAHVRLARAQQKLRVRNLGPLVAAVDQEEFVSNWSEIVERRVEETREALRHAQDRILVSGIANEFLTSKLGKSKELEEFFGRGGVLQAIFIDPAGEAVRRREVLEGHPSERFHKLPLKAAMNIASLRMYRPLIDVANRRRQRQGQSLAGLEIYLHDREPALNLLIIDDRWAAVHHYGVKAKGNLSPRITIDLPPNLEDDPQGFEGITESQVSLRYYEDDFEALRRVSRPLDASEDWVTCANAFKSWDELATVDVDGELFLKHPHEDSPAGRLNAAIEMCYARRQQEGTPLQQAEDDLRKTRALITDLESRLQDAERRGMASGELDGVRFRIFDDRAPRRVLVCERLKAAKRTIDVVGVVNEWVTTDLPDERVLAPFFNGGGRMRALFINPNGEAVKQREALERHYQDREIKKGDFATRTKLAIDTLWQYRDAQCQVSVYERQPGPAILIIDERWALLTHYGLTSRGVTTPVIEVDLTSGSPISAGMLKYYQAEFEVLLGMKTTTRWEWDQAD